ncbi:beta-1,6-N-acetylglucosaminyltransferase [Amylibacter sp. IMCC11727]|uniref:DUF5927 domain-containing protein n=1 Tax=Amylibacter sp. IMCC11727 TaxID=3039851 RepID=UPI00244DC5D8|nr:beta-1,6-N-acetylglucosaminyltransferase [Amylibacter sp. IMCC11727]WGI22078.1 beta-1,6-N-acetylglucosaminyltransferase [Amylibacter sp. IMCC11727]
MRLGFVILAHTDLHRVAELIAHLSKEDCVVGVHIDKKVSNVEFDAFKSSVQSFDNVVLSKRTACEWGEFSLVRATLDASEKLLNTFDDISHVSLISGSCLPIRPVRQMKRFLKRNAGTDYIESVSVENNYWVKDGLNEERFTFYFPFSWRKQRRLFDALVDVQRWARIKRKIPEPLVPHIGSQWWTLTAKTLRTIINDPKRPYYDAYFSWSWIPDESYFQTLARLHSSSIESRSLTFSKFDYLGKPFVFYDDHLKELTQSDCFWARKIWGGADKLYSSLLDENRANQPMSGADPKAFDEKFEAADVMRCEGGLGRFHQGRYPYDRAERTGVSVSPFTVFVGFKPIYRAFSDWVDAHTDGISYGSIFARTNVGDFDPETHFYGNLPAEPKVRNRNPKGYLANLLWGGQDQHQNLMYDFRDSPRIVGTLAHDEMAKVILVRHSWMLGLLHSSASFENQLSNAKRLQRLERRFLAEFDKDTSKADLTVMDLEDVLAHPSRSLRAAIEHMPKNHQGNLNVMPERFNTDGLDNFAKKLRNHGLNIDYEPLVRPKDNKKQDTVFEKPYVVK